MKTIIQYFNDLINENINQSVTFDGNNVNHINRWLVTTVASKNKPFDEKVLLDICDLSFSKWKYYVSTDAESFYKRNNPEKSYDVKKIDGYEHYIYCLSNIYMQEEKTLLLRFSTTLPIPIKIWINDNLVYCGTFGNFKKNWIFSYDFQKGNNTVLVEKPMCTNNRILAHVPKFFSLTIRPIDTITNNKLSKTAHMDTVFREHLEKVSIITSDIFYDKGDKIGIIVFKNSFRKIHETGEISFFTNNSNCIHREKVICNEFFYISLGDISQQIIKIEYTQDNRIFDTSFIFIGDYESYKKKVKKQKNNYETDIIESLDFNLDLLDSHSNFVKNTIELAHQGYTQPILKKLFLLQNSTHNKSKEISNGFNVWKSKIDNNPFVYNLVIPNNYDSSKKYPLLVSFNFDDCKTNIPQDVNQIMSANFSNTFSLVFCGLYEHKYDFLNDTDITDVIMYIIKNFSIDSRKINFLGVCTGASRGFYFIHNYPQIFQCIISVSGIVNEKLSCINNTNITNVLNIDDNYINGSAAITMLPDDKTYLLSGFEHEEFFDYFCNKNLQYFIDESMGKEFKLPQKSLLQKIYNNNCFIIGENEVQNEFEKIIIQYIKYPVDTNYRKYDFPVLNDEQKIFERVKKCNFILPVNINNISKTKEKLLKYFCFSTSSNKLKISRNPFNSELYAAIIFYEDETIIEEIKIFLSGGKK